jgi:spore coat protein CotH
MRSIFVILALLIAGCASLAGVDYQPYAGKANVYQGEAEQKVIVDNVDLWADGTSSEQILDPGRRDYRGWRRLQ